MIGWYFLERVRVNQVIASRCLVAPECLHIMVMCCAVHMGLVVCIVLHM